MFRYTTLSSAVAMGGFRAVRPSLPTTQLEAETCKTGTWGRRQTEVGILPIFCVPHLPAAVRTLIDSAHPMVTPTPKSNCWAQRGKSVDALLRSRHFKSERLKLFLPVEQLVHQLELRFVQFLDPFLQALKRGLERNRIVRGRDFRRGLGFGCSSPALGDHECRVVLRLGSEAGFKPHRFPNVLRKRRPNRDQQEEKRKTGSMPHSGCLPVFVYRVRPQCTRAALRPPS